MAYFVFRGCFSSFHFNNGEGERISFRGPGDIRLRCEVSMFSIAAGREMR